LAATSGAWYSVLEDALIEVPGGRIRPQDRASGKGFVKIFTKSGEGWDENGVRAL